MIGRSLEQDRTEPLIFVLNSLSLPLMELSDHSQQTENSIRMKTVFSKI
jgi:hypothetical protein